MYPSLNRLTAQIGFQLILCISLWFKRQLRLRVWWKLFHLPIWDGPGTCPFHSHFFFYRKYQVNRSEVKASFMRWLMRETQPSFLQNCYFGSAFTVKTTIISWCFCFSTCYLLVWLLLYTHHILWCWLVGCMPIQWQPQAVSSALVISTKFQRSQASFSYQRRKESSGRILKDVS